MKNTGPLQSFATAAIRVATRAYTRHAPWRLGRSAAYDFYHNYVGWRGLKYRTTAWTRFGDRMELHLPDGLSTVLYMIGHWEPLITQYVRSRLSAGDIFIDCGANIGYYTLIASRLVGAQGHVFAIEASELIYQRLMNHVQLNRCANVTGIHAAASNAKGELSLFLARDSNLGHSTTVQGLAAKESMVFESKVPADTLSNLVGAANLYNARFVKIDVEGAEISVLEPLFASLHSFSPRTEWLLEFSPEFAAGGQKDVDQIYYAFRSAGYAIYQIPNDYGSAFTVNPPPLRLKRLSAPPTDYLCDVLISRNDLSSIAD